MAMPWAEEAGGSEDGSRDLFDLYLLSLLHLAGPW